MDESLNQQSSVRCLLCSQYSAGCWGFKDQRKTALKKLLVWSGRQLTHTGIYTKSLQGNQMGWQESNNSWRQSWKFSCKLWCLNWVLKETRRDSERWRGGNAFYSWWVPSTKKRGGRKPAMLDHTVCRGELFNFLFYFLFKEIYLKKLRLLFAVMYC